MSAHEHETVAEGCASYIQPQPTCYLQTAAAQRSLLGNTSETAHLMEPLEAWSSIGMPQTTTLDTKKLDQAPEMVDRANKNEQCCFEPALLRRECCLCIQQPRNFSCMQMHALCGCLDCMLTLTAHACPTKHSRGVAACEEAVEAVCRICGPCPLYYLAVIEALAASS